MDGDKGVEMDQAHGMSDPSQQMNYAQQSVAPLSDWQALEDHYNMVDENQLEPDYYIDQPPDAQFIADEEGVDKAIQLNNIDPDLFDYNLEVEPIL